MYKHQSLEALIKLKKSLKPEETICLPDVWSTKMHVDDRIKKTPPKVNSSRRDNANFAT